MKYADIEKSANGIVYVRINPIDPTHLQFDEYLESTLAQVKQAQGGVMILNISKGKFLNSEQRIKIGNFYKIHRDAFRTNLKGMAFVNTSFIAMTVLKGIFLVNNPPVEYTVVSSEQEAEQWAIAKMYTNGRR